MLEKVADEGGFKGAGKLSPDGKKLAISEGDPQNDITVLDLNTGTKTRLTFGGATHLMPAWSPDGKSVVYIKQTRATLVTGTTVCMRQANGGGQEKVIVGTGNPGEATYQEPQISGDGRYLLYLQQSGPSDAAIWAMPLSGDQKPLAVVKPQNAQTRIVHYSMSPDGEWLAYTSTESGREEVYVTHFPSGEGRWQVSQTSGTSPLWRADGKEIYYAGLQDAIFHAVSVVPSGEDFEVGQAQAMFPINIVAPLGTPYDPAPDGQRFILATYPESVSAPLVLVTNWSAGVNK